MTRGQVAKSQKEAPEPTLQNGEAQRHGGPKRPKRGPKTELVTDKPGQAAKRGHRPKALCVADLTWCVRLGKVYVRGTSSSGARPRLARGRRI